jgi:CheY-like chemotaxis protein
MDMGTTVPCKVLVADDYPNAADAIAALCSDYYQVRTAYTGREALRTALSWRPRVAILDIDMPAPNGLAIAASIRVAPDLEPISLVAVTGRTHSYDRSVALAHGFNAFLSKPVDGKELLELIASFCKEDE